jgi:group I intron endonuclease
MYSIYIIKNILKGKVYIGSTNNFKQRIYRHLFELRRNKHHSIHLQRAWNKYGEENFTYFELLTELTKEQAKEKEEFLINKYYDVSYNVSKKSSGGDLISYHPNLDEIKEKHREIGNNWWESKTEEEKKEFANKFVGENNAMYGKTHTSEARKKISEVQKGRKMSDEQKTIVSNTQRKRYSNPEERKKVSQRNIERYKDPIQRVKTSEANKKRYSDPIEREKMSVSGKKRYEKNYKVFIPNENTLNFKNLCDIIEYFKENYNVGRWVIKNLLKSGIPWDTKKKEFENLKGLQIIVEEID